MMHNFEELMCSVLKIAQDQVTKNNPYYDLSAYKQFSNALQLKQEQKLDCAAKCAILKDTSVTENIENIVSNDEGNCSSEVVANIVSIITEEINNLKVISKPMCEKLIQTDVNSLTNIFHLLSPTINSEDVITVWYSISSHTNNDRWIGPFLRGIFVPHICNKIDKNYEEIMSNLSEQYNDHLQKEMLHSLLNEQLQSDLLLEYIDHLSDNFKFSLLESFITRSSNCDIRYIKIINILITTEMANEQRSV